MQMLYEDMKKRIENTTKLGQISEEISKEHKGFKSGYWLQADMIIKQFFKYIPYILFSHELNILN